MLGLRRLALLAMALALAGCAALEEVAPRPSARIAGARIAGLNLQQAELVFDVEIGNPYAISLPMLDLTYALASSGTRFLEGSIKPEQSIPARGTATVQVPATVSFASLMKVLHQIRPGSVVPYKVDLTAAVEAPLLGRLVVPVSREGELPVPAVPKIELAELRLDSFSVDEIRANARVKMTNTNRFALDLARLALNLAVGGKQLARTQAGKPGRLEPGESGTFDLALSISPVSVGTAVVNILRGSRASYALTGELEAVTPFGVLSLPLSSAGTASITR